MNFDLDQRLQLYVNALESLLGHPFLRMALLQSTAVLANLLLTLLEKPQREPIAELCRFYDSHTPMLAGLRASVLEALDSQSVVAAAVQDTNIIFGNAWTTFDPATYDHSVSLVAARLKASGIDGSAIKDRRCFDGGCGIGRLAVALAQLGAKEVVAVDRSDGCLDYFRETVQRLALSNITIVNGDVTDLSSWSSGSFDFVATNGVLHHTSDPYNGLQEHMRLVKDGGILWIYLYAQGGIYWPTFDAIRQILHKIGAQDIREALLSMHLRPGFVYTFMDNMLAPRTYHTIEEVVCLLSQKYELMWREADGPSLYDSPSRTAASPTASLLLGPQGEVRIVINKLRTK